MFIHIKRINQERGNKMDIKPIHLIAIGLAILVASAYGYINLGITPPTPSGPETPTTPTVPEEDIRAATAQWRIRDALSKTATESSDTAYVDIIRAVNGVFDPLNPVEQMEFASDPDYSATTFSAGDDLVIHVTSDNDPTGGYETYPRWFYIKDLDHGVPVKSFDIANPIAAINQVKSGSTYTFTVNEARLGDTVGTVTWLEGTTNYWDFGTFELYGRVAKDYLIQQITNKGTVGCTLNDGASWEDTDAEINANFTFTADTEDLYFELIGEANDVAYGLPSLAVMASGQVVQYSAVLVWTTDALGVDPIELANDGWMPISKPDLTADVAYYYVIDPDRDGGIPDRGTNLDISIPITVSDASLTASTEYEFEGWVLDWQNVANVKIGATTTSLPGSNGFISEHGCDTIVEPLALTVSSGSAATMQLLGHFTTNA